jgi:hypothetical protein
MFQRTDVEFEADGGVKLRGWLYVPSGPAGGIPPSRWPTATPA